MLLGADFFKVARAMKPTFRSAYKFPEVRDPVWFIFMLPSFHQHYARLINFKRKTFHLYNI